MWPAASRRPQNRTRGRSRRVGHGREVFLAHVDLHRPGALRRVIPAAAQTQQHGDAALDVIADQKIVGAPDGDVVMRDCGQAQKAPGAGVGGDDLAYVGKGQMEDFEVPG